MLNKLKKKINNNLLIKNKKLKRKIKLYENKILKDIEKEQEYIDEINLLQEDIRELSLKLSKEDRECWLKERNENEKRDTPKKK